MHAQNAPSAPDPWKAGSSNSTTGKESRKLNENKLLSKKNRWVRFTRSSSTHGFTYYTWGILTEGLHTRLIHGGDIRGLQTKGLHTPTHGGCTKRAAHGGYNYTWGYTKALHTGVHPGG